jgi:hypothetical protein
MTDDDVIEWERIADADFRKSEKQPEDYRRYAARLHVLAGWLQNMPNLRDSFLKRAANYREIAKKVNMMPRYKYD